MTTPSQLPVIIPLGKMVENIGQDVWTRNEEYHNKLLIKDDIVLKSAVQRSVDNNLPDIAVSQSQGKFLHLHARAIGAKKILEVGTLGG